MTVGTRGKMPGEPNGDYIARRASEIYLEEAYLQDPFGSAEEQMFRSAKLLGLISGREEQLDAAPAEA